MKLSHFKYKRYSMFFYSAIIFLLEQVSNQFRNALFNINDLPTSTYYTYGISLPSPLGSSSLHHATKLYINLFFLSSINNINERMNDSSQKIYSEQKGQTPVGLNRYKMNYKDPSVMENVERYGLGDTLIINDQIEVPIDFGLIERQTQIIKEIMRIGHLDNSITFVTKDKMRQLNNESKGKDIPTDILSFPTTRSPDDKITEPDDLFLGDIFICPKYIQERAISDLSEYEKQLETPYELWPQKEKGINRVLSEEFSAQTRIIYMIIHGLLHLRGYDHETDYEYHEMSSKEEEIVQSFEKLKESFRVSNSGHYTIGIGTDLCQISRFKPLIKKFEHLLIRHILSAREKYFYNNLKKKIEKKNLSTVDWFRVTATFFAKRFAIKEAASKALGTGLRYLSPRGVSLNNIELLHQKSGKPYIELNGLALDVANKLGVSNSFATISDESGIAFAFVTLVGSHLHQNNSL